MVKQLSEWEMEIYSALWKKFKGRVFTNKEIQKDLKVDDMHKIGISRILRRMDGLK